MKARKNSDSLQHTILLITLIFTIIIGSILSLFFSHYYTSYLQMGVIQDTDANLSFMVDSINQNITEINRLVQFCQTNNRIGTFMNYKENTSKDVSMKAYERLSEEFISSTANSYIHRLIIGNNHDYFLQIVDPTFSTSQNVAKISTELAFFESQLNSNNSGYTNGFIMDPYTKSFTQPVLVIIRPITHLYSQGIGGYVSFSLEPTLFTAPMQYYSLAEDSELYLTLGEHVYLMDNNTTLTEIDTSHITIDMHDNHYLPETIIAHDYYNNETNIKSIAVTKKLNIDDCYITQLVSGHEISSSKPYTYMIILFIISLIIVIGFILSIILYKIIDIPVVKIQHRLEQISSGNFSRDTSIEWNHELGDIGRGINDLSENIVALMNSKIQDEKDKKDLEYKMLQSQINPHFLYNTLNSIKWMAVTQGADGIAEMTTSLSRLLRSISKGTQLLIPISDELSLVKDYFTIQQYRYGGTLSLTVNVDDDDLLCCNIIKFTLQPLVENAIFHGIEPKGSTGTITIHIYRETDEFICICVEDDGVGISEDRIEQILNDTSTDSAQFFKEIGISNINKRIKYEFGEEYGLSIESETNKYTKMILRIPYKNV